MKRIIYEFLPSNLGLCIKYLCLYLLLIHKQAVLSLHCIHLENCIPYNSSIHDYYESNRNKSFDRQSSVCLTFNPRLSEI